MDEILLEEYTRFLNKNYTLQGNDWIRAKDDKVILIIEDIIQDFKNSIEADF